MGRHDRMGGLIWLILGIGIVIGSIKLNLGNLHKPGPGFMPFLSGALLVILGLILLIYTFISKGSWEEKVKLKKIREKGNWKIFLLTLVALFAYAILLEPLGFIFSTFLFLFSTFKITEPKKWLAPFVFSVSTIVLSYFIFSVWLKCQFPKGILRF